MCGKVERGFGMKKSDLVKRSDMFIPTLFKAPMEASTQSHQLMLRAGVMRKSSTGIFSLLPVGVRSLEKLVKEVEERMREVGGEKLMMPILLPSNVWKKTGRWETSGEELIKVRDRRGEEYCLGPTHEELFTQLVASEVTSHKQLPLLLYQIGVKYRDEKRPRFGLMRAREFIMKDLYSFHLLQQDAFQTYWKLYHAYSLLFTRLQLPFAAAEADTGNIGGNLSHEFHVLSNVGEDSLLSCPSCNYLSNIEKANRFVDPHLSSLSSLSSLSNLSSHSPSTKGIQFVELLVDVLGKEFEEKTRCSFWMDLITLSFYKSKQEQREDKEMKKEGKWSKKEVIVVRSKERQTNPFKLKNLEKYDEIQVRELNCGELGREELKDLLENKQIIVDVSFFETFLKKEGEKGEMENKRGLLKGELLEKGERAVREGRVKVMEVSVAKKGDKCGKEGCSGGELEEKRGIEVGQVFYLGKKYSEALGAVVFDKNKEKKTLEMGCYGLGMTRILAAAVEVLSDKDGIVWPLLIAPYRLLILPVTSPHKQSPSSSTHKQTPSINQNTESKVESEERKMEENEEKAFELGEEIIKQLPSFKGEVVVDERSEVTFGYKMKEALLIGYPFLLIVGSKHSTASNSSTCTLFEFRERSSPNKIHLLTIPQIIERLSQKFSN